MFGKFLGKENQKSSLPKNQIEVACPLCGAVQHEPRMVLTTLCRNCGEHLRVDKGRVMASSKINPVPSTVYPAVQDDDSTAQKCPEPGTISQIINDSDLNDHAAATKYSTLRPPASVQPATPQSTLHKMKEQGESIQHYFKKVDCFDCGKSFKVGRSAKSTNCPTCGVYICLENFEITLNSTTPIRTRGDVMVRRNGKLSTTEIHCRNLTVQGSVSGNIDCTGDFIINTSGKHIGSVNCHRIVIEKGSDIRFLNTIVANEIVVRGIIYGNIQCNGSVIIAETGRVNGDVTAHSVSIQPGGQLDGAMHIIRSSLPKPPPSSNQPPSPSQEASAPAVGRHD